MSKYVLAFRGQPDHASQPDEDQKWGAWFGSLGGAITDMGNRVGTVRTLRSQVRSDPATAVLRGYFVITAGDADEAARLASGCPGLRNGVSVEVGEIAEA